MKKLLLSLLFATTAQADCDCACIQHCSITPAPTPSLEGLKKACPGGIKGLKTPILWKPESQGMAITDPRLGKPCLLSSSNKFSNKTKLRLYSRDGIERGTMGLYGSFQGGNRYYSGFRNGTGETASQLKAEGVEYAEGEDGICYGPFDPTQRTGGY